MKAQNVKDTVEAFLSVEKWVNRNDFIKYAARRFRVKEYVIRNELQNGSDYTRLKSAPQKLPTREGGRTPTY